MALPAIAAGVGLASGILGADARRDAARAAAKAGLETAEDIAILGDEYWSGIQDRESGYANAGEQGLANVSDLVKSGKLAKQYGDYEGELTFDPSSVDVTQDPGYAFRLQQGVAARDAGAGAKGQLFSGAQAKDLAKYGQELGSQEYGAAFDRSFNVHKSNTAKEYNNYLTQLNDYNQNLRNQYADSMGLVNIGEASTGRLNQGATNFLSNQTEASKLEGAANQQLASMDDMFLSGLFDAASGAAGGFLENLPISSAAGAAPAAAAAAAPVETSLSAQLGDPVQAKVIEGVVGAGEDFNDLVPMNNARTSLSQGIIA